MAGYNFTELQNIPHVECISHNIIKQMAQK